MEISKWKGPLALWLQVATFDLPQRFVEKYMYYLTHLFLLPSTVTNQGQWK